MGGLDGMLASTHPWGIRGRLHISVRQLAGAKLHISLGGVLWGGGVINENCKSTRREKAAHRLSGSCTSTIRQLHLVGPKHTHAASSFENHIAMIPTLKSDLNFDEWFESYAIL